MTNNLQQLYGNIDIYLFDQLLKGRFNQCKKVLDVGCGGGRNLIYFLQNDHDVYGIDPNPDAIEQVKSLAQALTPAHTPENLTWLFAARYYILLTIVTTLIPCCDRCGVC
jgi:tellurite methyltransferase